MLKRWILIAWIDRHCYISSIILNFFKKRLYFYGNTFFHIFLVFRPLWSQITFPKFWIQSSPWIPILDIYKCPFSKTKSRIYFLVQTEKKEIKKPIFNQMIYGLSTEILINTMGFLLLRQFGDPILGGVLCIFIDNHFFCDISYYFIKII